MRGKNVYWKAGMTVFFTTAALLLFYDTLFGSRTALKLLNKLAGALTPILYGAAMTLAALAVFANYARTVQKQFGGLSGDLAGWFLQRAEFWMLAALVLCQYGEKLL